MIWNNILVENKYSFSELLEYFSVSFLVSKDDIKIINSIEEILEVKSKIVLLIEESEDFNDKYLINIYFFDGMDGDVSNLKHMAKTFKMNIFLPDEESGNYRDLLLIDRFGGVGKVTM